MVMVSKLPGVNFINILRALFLPISFRQKIMKSKYNRKKLGNALSDKKCALDRFLYPILVKSSNEKERKYR